MNTQRGVLWSIDRLLKSPNLFSPARLPSFPDWKHVEAGELGEWWQWWRWWWWGWAVGCTDEEEEKCVCVCEREIEKRRLCVWERGWKQKGKKDRTCFRLVVLLQWLCAFLSSLEQCDPAAVALRSLNFWISESGKSCWLIPKQSQAQSFHLTWAIELSCTWIWCNTWSLLPPTLLSLPSLSLQQHVYSLNYD